MNFTPVKNGKVINRSDEHARVIQAPLQAYHLWERPCTNSRNSMLVRHYLTGVPDAIKSLCRQQQNIMSDSKYGRFRCIHCGCRFNLNDEENEAYENGFFMIDPDCCDDCFDNLEHAPDYPEFSDADPGL